MNWTADKMQRRNVGLGNEKKKKEMEIPLKRK